MGPDKIFIFCFVVFVALFISHYLTLRAGWRMGIKADRGYVPEPPIAVQSSKKYINELDQERLDYE